MELTARIQSEEGSYWADVSELPGCLASGDTLDELLPVPFDQAEYAIRKRACKAVYTGSIPVGRAAGAFPDDDGMRRYVDDLLRIADEENGYEQAALEHRAFAELIVALGTGKLPTGWGGGSRFHDPRK